jgi:hypothetical protein
MAFVTGLSTQKKQVDKVMEEYKDIFSSPTGVPLHCQVKHSIDLNPTHVATQWAILLPLSIKNEEIKC